MRLTAKKKKTAATDDPDSRTTPESFALFQEAIYGLTKIGTPKEVSLEVAAGLVPEVVRFVRSRLDAVEPGRRQSAIFQAGKDGAR